MVSLSWRLFQVMRYAGFGKFSKEPSLGRASELVSDWLATRTCEATFFMRSNIKVMPFVSWKALKYSNLSSRRYVMSSS